MISQPDGSEGSAARGEGAAFPFIVELTPQEIRVAVIVGANRNVRAYERGRRHRYGADEARGWSMHTQGAAAEIAVAKAFNRYWTDTPDPDYTGDVGPYHVRSTKHEEGGLLLHPDDPDDGVFVLVVGEIPVFRLAGWILGREGKRERFWLAGGPGGSGRPCFKVPQRELFPIEELER